MGVVGGGRWCPEIQGMIRIQKLINLVLNIVKVQSRVTWPIPDVNTSLELQLKPSRENVETTSHKFKLNQAMAR